MFCKKEFGIECKAEVSNGGAAGRRLVNIIASVLLKFTLSFHLVKYLCSMSIAEVSRRAMVSRVKVYFTSN